MSAFLACEIIFKYALHLSAHTLISRVKCTQGGMCNTISFVLGQARWGRLLISCWRRWTVQLSASGGKCQGTLGAPSWGILWVPGHGDFCSGCAGVTVPPPHLLYTASWYQPSRVGLHSPSVKPEMFPFKGICKCPESQLALRSPCPVLGWENINSVEDMLPDLCPQLNLETKAETWEIIESHCPILSIGQNNVKTEWKWPGGQAKWRREQNAFLPPRVYKLTLFQFTKMFSLNSVFKNESTFRS